MSVNSEIYYYAMYRTTLSNTLIMLPKVNSPKEAGSYAKKHNVTVTRVLSLRDTMEFEP